jgi:hypothetical protein
MSSEKALRLDDKSRMSREAHVRLCESVTCDPVALLDPMLKVSSTL